MEDADQTITAIDAVAAQGVRELQQSLVQKAVPLRRQHDAGEFLGVHDTIDNIIARIVAAVRAIPQQYWSDLYIDDPDNPEGALLDLCVFEVVEIPNGGAQALVSRQALDVEATTMQIRAALAVNHHRRRGRQERQAPVQEYASALRERD